MLPLSGADGRAGDTIAITMKDDYQIASDIDDVFTSRDVAAGLSLDD